MSIFTSAYIGHVPRNVSGSVPASSPLNRSRKLWRSTDFDGEPVSFARYTGQESPDERKRILAEPPDILLTNYVMLELVLTRPDERKRLVRAAQGLLDLLTGGDR